MTEIKLKDFGWTPLWLFVIFIQLIEITQALTRIATALEKVAK